MWLELPCVDRPMERRTPELLLSALIFAALPNAL